MNEKSFHAQIASKLEAHRRENAANNSEYRALDVAQMFVTAAYYFSRGDQASAEVALLQARDAAMQKYS